MIAQEDSRPAGRIDWRDWSEPTFAEARRTDKPILLRLSAVWCHWCHVMDSTSDREPEAIRLLNENYIPIRVDIDHFPDVSERYNFGGFPTSAILTPEGEIMTGGTYIPPREFVELLRSVEDMYRTRKDEVEKRLREARDHEKAHRKETAPSAQGTPGALDAARKVLEDTTTSVLLHFDADHGGFGTAPKFPHPAALELTLRRWLETGDKEYATIVRRTLHAIQSGALWDKEEKAFFRYATNANWTTPHYEKMLEGNAGLLSNYATAARAFNHAEWFQVVREQTEYLRRVLRDPTTGLFAGSQDADEAYYALARAERQGQKPPFVDRTRYTDWNAQMIVALFDGYVATGDPLFRADGLQALDRLVAEHYRPDLGFHHFSRPGEPAQRTGLFTDQVHALYALLRGHELTGRADLMRLAEATYAHAKKTLWDPSESRFLDRVVTGKELGRLRKKNPTVVENGIALRCLLRLAEFSPSDVFRADAEALLRSYRPESDRWGIFAASLATGALEFAHAPLVVHVVAEGDEAARFLEQVGQIRHPFVLVRVLTAEAALDAATNQGLGTISAPGLFACSGRTCSRVYRPGEPFAEALSHLVAPAGAQKSSTG